MNATSRLSVSGYFHYRNLPVFRPSWQQLSDASDYPTAIGQCIGHNLPLTVISDIASNYPTVHGSIRQCDHYSIIGRHIPTVHTAKKHLKIGIYGM
ncbi:MAG: hypothetical protein II981_04595 [Bacteroidales bacterium]|nr:hypothetical protein [Bacteroidales bacterium]